MSERDGDGPAFPQVSDVGWSYAGLTVRDYFAARALTLGGEFFHNFGNGCDSAEHVAQAVYQIADAMLAARKAAP